jgi:hypothetical protein
MEQHSSFAFNFNLRRYPKQLTDPAQLISDGIANSVIMQR